MFYNIQNNLLSLFIYHNITSVLRKDKRSAEVQREAIVRPHEGVSLSVGLVGFLTGFFFTKELKFNEKYLFAKKRLKNFLKY